MSDIDENLSVGKIKPGHDFIGAFAIEDNGMTRLYAVVPRFWNHQFPDQERDFNGTPLRILTQNKTSEMPKSEADLVESSIKQIKGVYSEHKEDYETVEDNDDDESSGELLDQSYEFDELEILSKLINLCDFYYARKDIAIGYNASIHGNQLVLHQQLIQKLELLLREIKRSYRSVIGMTQSVRGRITNKGMMMMVAKPSTSIECEFQSFDIHSVLYRIFATVLEIIGASTIKNHLRFLGSKYDNIPQRSQILRNRLSEIKSFTIHQALQESIRIDGRLPRSFRKFQKCLEFSIILLKEESIQIDRQSDAHDLWHITAPTSKLWEKLLERTFESISSFSEVEPQVKLHGPWLKTDFSNNKSRDKFSKNIDLTVKTTNEEILLIDAKYSIPKEMPDSTYQYQQFFYMSAYKAQKKILPATIGLLHPGVPARVISTLNLEQKLADTLSQNVEFNVWQLPFPQPEDINDQYLVSYLENTASDFEALLHGKLI
tara:strand:+ start:1100 stop:2566 length:1467 start_codon:yes stop_codon:yes gene_type:complete